MVVVRTVPVDFRQERVNSGHYRLRHRLSITALLCITITVMKLAHCDQTLHSQRMVYGAYPTGN